MDLICLAALSMVGQDLLTRVGPATLSRVGQG
jgi:hypothetical protein